MACRPIINSKKEIEEVRLDDGTLSPLFQQLKTKVGSSRTAYRIWAATQSDLFKSDYKAAGFSLSDKGEPVLISEQSGQNYFGSSDNRFLSFAYSEKNQTVNKYISAEQSGYLASLAENPMNGIDVDIPLTDIERVVFDQNEDVFYKIINKRRAVSDILLRSKRIKRDSNGRYLNNKNQIVKGVSFNDNNISMLLRPLNKERFANWKSDKTFGENMAEIVFADKPDNHTIDLGDGKIRDKDNYIKHLNENVLLGQLKGDLIGLYSELNYLHPESKEASIIESLIESKIEEVAKSGKKINKASYEYIKSKKDNINRVLGINETTTVIHELEVVSDIFNTVAKIDKIIIQPDGSIRPVEIKSSSKIDDVGYGKMMNYSLRLIEDNKLNQAKIQLIMGMMNMLSVNPNVRFYQPTIANYSDKRLVETESFAIPISPEEIVNILAMLENFYNAAENEEIQAIKDNLDALKLSDPNRYKALFNYQNYTSNRDIKFSRLNNNGKIEVVTIGEVETSTYEKALDAMVMGIGYDSNLIRFAATAKSSKSSEERKLYDNIEKGFKDFFNILSDKDLDPSIWMKDLSFMNYWVGATIFNMRNPLIQSLAECYQAQMLKYNKDKIEATSQFEAFFLPAFNNWRKKRNESELKNFNETVGGINKSSLFKEDVNSFWNQFYVFREGETTPYRRKLPKEFPTDSAEYKLLSFLDGYYKQWVDDNNENSFLRQRNSLRTNYQGNIEVLSHAERLMGLKKHTYIAKSNKRLYTELTTHIPPVSDEEKAAGVTKEKEELPFMPTVPKHQWEIAALRGESDITSSVKKAFKKLVMSYFERIRKEQEDEDATLLIPIKYIGTPGYNINDYSLDLQYQFEKFNENMLSKKYMEGVLAYAEAAALYFTNRQEEFDKNSNKAKLAVDFIQKQFRWIIKGELPDDPIADIRRATGQLMGFPIKFKNSNTGDYDEYFITIYSLLKGMRSTAAYVVMTLNPVGGLFNAIQAVFATTKLGLTQSMAATKLLGIDTQFKDFTVDRLAWAYKEATTTDDTLINGDLKKTKLALISQHLSWLPSDYAYKNFSSSVTLRPNALMSPSKLMWFYTVVEEANSLAILAAQLDGMKLYHANGKPQLDANGKHISMWDAYEVVETDEVEIAGNIIKTGNKMLRLKFNGDSRGKTYENGKMVDVTELTNKEVIKLKRVYERIQGNYRYDERSIAELYILGQTGLQFMRWMPSLIRNMFQSRAVDSSLGSYKNENGNLIWTPRRTVGKYRLLAGMFTSSVIRPIYSKFSGGKDGKISITDNYSWEHLEEDERIQVLDFLTTLFLSSALYLGAVFRKQSSGEDDPIYKILDRLRKTVSQPWDIFQVISAVKNWSGGVGVKIWANQLLGLIEVTERIGLYALGIEDSIYNDKGNVPGVNRLARNLPFTKSLMEAQGLLFEK